MKLHLFIPFLTLFILGSTSCASPTKEMLKTTYGKKFQAPSNFAFIPGGNMSISPDEKITLAGFFMSKFEISNKDYNEFLADLLRQGRTEEHKIAVPKSKYWMHATSMENYHIHPVYADYPVVNISKKDAEMYCEWLTEKLKKQYPGYQLKVNLPTENEWIYAARGGHEYAPYPWGGYFYRNSKGLFLANFKRVGSGNVTYDRKNDKYTVLVSNSKNTTMPAPVNSFHPNDYGLYNMSGNAAELLATDAPSGGIRTKGGSYDSTGYDIRIDAEDEFKGWTEPSPFIGFRPVLNFIKK